MSAELSKLWSQCTFVAFDTETSGRFPLSSEIVELAAVKWRDGQIVETFQYLIKPSQPMGEHVIKIHHITNEMVAQAPSIDSVLPLFDVFIRDSVLVAHQAAFDLGFLTVEYERLGIPLPQEVAIDTCLLARKAYPSSPNHRLATLCNLLQIKMGTAHRALDDSFACLELGLACMKKFGSEATLEYIFSVHGPPLTFSRFSIAQLTSQATLQSVVRAARERLVIEIVYYGGTKPGVPRKVTATGLVRNPNGDFMSGICHRDNTEKRFFITKITIAKILD